MELIMSFIVSIGWPKTLFIFAVEVAVLLYAIKKSRTSRARAYVLKRRATIKNRMEDARLLVREWVMMKITERAFFTGLEREFEHINRLNRFTDADWVAERKAIDAFGERLERAISTLMAGEK